MIDITLQKKLVYYGGNYTTYVRTRSENEVNQMKAYAKQQEEIAHIKSESLTNIRTFLANDQNSLLVPVLMPIWSSRPSPSKRLSIKWRLPVWSRKSRLPRSCDSTLKMSRNYRHLLSLSPMLPSRTLERRRITSTRSFPSVLTWTPGKPKCVEQGTLADEQNRYCRRQRYWKIHPSQPHHRCPLTHRGIHQPTRSTQTCQVLATLG